MRRRYNLNQLTRGGVWEKFIETVLTVNKITHTQILQIVT